MGRLRLAFAVVTLMSLVDIGTGTTDYEYYADYKGEDSGIVGTVSKWVLYNDSPGCGADFISTPTECFQAAGQLGFRGQIIPGRWSDKPPGCSAGTEGYIYFNEDFVGTTGIASLRSICLSRGSALIPEAFALRIPGCEEEDDVVYYGHDLVENKVFSNGTVADCANWCGEVEECKFWTFEKSAKRCWLKDDKGTDRRIDHDRVSGSKECADPKIDCEFGPWGEFEACTASCGGGSMTRWRNISVEAQFGGQECRGSKNETRICNAEECPPPDCGEEEHHISCCPIRTSGDNAGEREEFLPENLATEATCAESCKKHKEGSVGITESKTQYYYNGKPKCWCEFGVAKHSRNLNYQTCMFIKE